MSKKEKQIFLLNTDDRAKVEWPIEEKFRVIADRFGARVCCIYDVCRVAIE